MRQYFREAGGNLGTADQIIATDMLFRGITDKMRSAIDSTGGKGHTGPAKDGDFLFPSIKASGSVPLSASVFVADHLRPAAKKTGVQIEDGQRFGLHNLRHSLSNWLVNKAKVEPKTVQGILRHARIQTLDLNMQGDGDETRAAQGNILQRWECLHS